MNVNFFYFREVTFVALSKLFCFLVLLSSLCLFCSPQTATAQITWSGDVDPANATIWDSNTHANIGNTGYGELDIFLNTSVQIQTGTIGNISGSVGEVSVSGGARWRILRDLHIGNSGNGVLSITEGGAVNILTGYVGHNFGARGEVEVDGTSSIWRSRFLHIGYEGSGALVILNGGKVESTFASTIGYGEDSASEVLVDGADSTWRINHDLTVGAFGRGELAITNRGNVSSRRNASVASEFGSFGSISVNGNDSVFNVFNILNIGESGNGFLSVTEGGSVLTKIGVIGGEIGSVGEVLVDGLGSIWTNRSSLEIGRSGQGKLEISNGGRVMGGTSTISGPNAEVIVRGNESTWITNSLFVANGGNGVLKITENASVRSGGSGYIGRSPGAIGTVNISNGSTWDITRYLYVGSGGTGTLNLEESSILNSGESYIGRDTDSIGHVTLNGTGTIWTIRDGLNVGFHGEGTLTIINGGVVLNAQEDHTARSSIGTNANSIGTLTVDGIGSTWLSGGEIIVGRYGHGELNVTNSGYVACNSALRIGGPRGSSTGIVKITGSGSILNTGSSIIVGDKGTGRLLITNSGMARVEQATVSSTTGSIIIGSQSNSHGEVVIDGEGSSLLLDGHVYVGNRGNGNLTISNGGTVTGLHGFIGNSNNGAGLVHVNGMHSQWIISDVLTFGHTGRSSNIFITQGGQVIVSGRLDMFSDATTSFINMSTGGMLALFGDADDSLEDFYSIINGTDAIRYWDDSAADWADLTEATLGSDYTLEFQTTGDLAGYTLLTVGTAVPEPSTVVLLLTACGAFGLLRRRTSKQF